MTVVLFDVAVDAVYRPISEHYFLYIHSEAGIEKFELVE